jgi:uncharacterized RDD family membrane protein YckC
MWLRSISITFLAWLARLVLSAVVLQYVIPFPWSGYMVAVPMWVLAVAVVFAAAEWAFHAQLPGKRETVTFVVSWVGLTVVLQVMYSFFLFGTVLPFINSLEIYIQYVLEILTIVTVAYLARRRRVKDSLGEGMVE